MSNSDDGSWLLVIGLGVAVYFGYQWWNKEPEPPRLEIVPQPTPSPLPRPTGLIPLISVKEGTIWSLNADSVKGDWQHRLAWVHEDHSKDKSRTANYSETFYSANCDTTSYAALQVVEYDKNGKVIKSFDYDDKPNWPYPPPNSNIETLIAAICTPSYDSPR